MGRFVIHLSGNWHAKGIGNSLYWHFFLPQHLQICSWHWFFDCQIMRMKSLLISWVYIDQIRSDQSLGKVVVGETWSSHCVTANARHVCPLPKSSGLSCPFWSAPSGRLPNTSPVSWVFCRPLVFPAAPFWSGFCGEWCGQTTLAFFFTASISFSCGPTCASIYTL